MSMPLVTAGGRYTGMLHLSTDSRRDPSDRARTATFHLQRALAGAVDRLRRPGWLAASLPPAMHAAAVSAAGEVFALDAREAGPSLRPEAPLVGVGARLLREGGGDRRFFWRDADGGWHRVALHCVDGLAVLAEQPGPLPHELTARELEVLTLLATGRSNADIGATLVISPRTVATHVEHVMEKLGCGSRAACAARAVAEGLLREPLPGAGARP
jgi:DNA-binding CsgD family transcriptional regulator